MSQAEELYNLAEETYDASTPLLEGDEYKGYDPEDYSSELENLEAGYGSGTSSFHTPNSHNSSDSTSSFHTPNSHNSSDSFKTIENTEGDGDQLENAEENVQDFVEENAEENVHHVIDIPPNASTGQIVRENPSTGQMAREYAIDTVDRATNWPQMTASATGLFFGIMKGLEQIKGTP